MLKLRLRTNFNSFQDGGRYDQKGNRLKYANPDYSERRSEPAQEPSNLIEDVPRPQQQYRYPKPSQNEAPSFPANSRVDQVRNPVKKVTVNSGPRFCLCLFSTITKYAEKLVGFSRIGTWIVGI